MSSNLGPDGWERVASELRACKESQRRAWGDIDNATLGRYLAGEASGDERARVEHALEELPELRRLTDLVRDVLGDLEPVALDAAPEPPPVLSLAAERARRRGLASFLGRRSSLVAAACLLVVLGVAMPRPARLTATPGEPAVAPGPGFASRPLAPEGLAGGVALVSARPAPRAEDRAAKGGVPAAPGAAQP